jgi:hypothetical protein
MLTAMPNARPRTFRREKNLSLRKILNANLRWCISIGD